MSGKIANWRNLVHKKLLIQQTKNLLINRGSEIYFKDFIYFRFKELIK